MDLTLVLHILAGSLGILSGFVALYSSKGAPVHRRAGLLFACVMLAMATSGAILAPRNERWMVVNTSAAITTAYLVATSLLTVRPTTRLTRRVETGAMLVALAVGATCLTLAVQAIAAGGSRNGVPAFPFVLFGGVATLGALLDLRMLRAGGTRGPLRLRRHLWRMSFALFVATMSFFIGQADVFPARFRIMPLLATPVLAVLGTMVYWLWKVRVRRAASRSHDYGTTTLAHTG